MVITLSAPGIRESAGKINSSSVSSSIWRLFVELRWKGQWHAASRTERPYFPNEVPKKCEFNQTLAAKAIACQVSRQGTTRAR